jgi:hypothetical protein
MDKMRILWRAYMLSPDLKVHADDGCLAARYSKQASERLHE